MSVTLKCIQLSVKPHGTVLVESKRSTRNGDAKTTNKVVWAIVMAGLMAQPRFDDWSLCHLPELALRPSIGRPWTRPHHHPRIRLPAVVPPALHPRRHLENDRTTNLRQTEHLSYQTKARRTRRQGRTLVPIVVFEYSAWTSICDIESTNSPVKATTRVRYPSNARWELFRTCSSSAILAFS